MPDLEKFVKNVMYGGIGAAASLVEKGGDLARWWRKGRKLSGTVRTRRMTSSVGFRSSATG